MLWFLRKALEEDQNFHVVVWCHFRAEVLRMIAEVKKTFPQFEVGTIMGAQKKSERLHALRLLKPETSPKGPVFVGGTFGTGSFGLDFTAAHTSVNCSYDYSFGKFKQEGDRVYGPGQEEPIAYYDVVATGPNGEKTIDHAMLAARLNTEDIANWTVSTWIKALKEE